MSLVELLKKTADLPEYRQEIPPRELLEEVLEAVRWTPSTANTQPWEVYLVADPVRKKNLDACLLDPLLRPLEGANRLSAAPLLLVLAMDVKRARARYGSQGEEFTGLQDLAAAVNNLRLAAVEKGLASSWVKEIDLDKVGAVLELSRLTKPFAVLTAGWPAEEQTGLSRPEPLKVEQWLHIIKEGDADGLPESN